MKAAPRPARRHKPAAERRDEILKATLTILAEDGLHAWTTARLAARVGVSEAGLFRHFASKEEILLSAVSGAADELRARVQGYQGRGDAWERARGLVLTVLDFVEQTGGAPLVLLSGHVAQVSKAIRRKAEETQQVLHARMTALFREAQAGHGRPVDAARLADLAVAVTQSAGMRWMLSGRRLPLRRTAMEMLELLKRCLGNHLET